MQYYAMASFQQIVTHSDLVLKVLTKLREASRFFCLENPGQIICDWGQTKTRFKGRLNILNHFWGKLLR